MLHIHLYFVRIHSVIKSKLLHTLFPTSQNIIHVGLLTIWLYLMRASAGWWIEWLRNLIPVSICTYNKCFVKFLLVFDRKSKFQLIYFIYILFWFNHLSMVITDPYNVLGLFFPYIPNGDIVSFEPLLHWYT